MAHIFVENWCESVGSFSICMTLHLLGPATVFLLVFCWIWASPTCGYTFWNKTIFCSPYSEHKLQAFLYNLGFIYQLILISFEKKPITPISLFSFWLIVNTLPLKSVTMLSINSQSKWFRADANEPWLLLWGIWPCGGYFSSWANLKSTQLHYLQHQEASLSPWHGVKSFH